MRRLLLGALAGTFILSISGSLATAQDGAGSVPTPTEQVPGGTGMGRLDSP